MAKLLQNYFAGRKFNIENGEFTSDFFTSQAGTPAGSCLGPLIFSLFINDIGDAISLPFVLYADDLVFLVNTTDLDAGLAEIENCYYQLIEWCEVNSLQVNQSKTKAMLFYKANDFKSKGLLGKQLDLRGDKIDVVESFKYLGVIVDSNLTFSEHYKHVECKMNIALGKMYSLRRFFNEDIVKTFISCYVVSIPDYCLSLWSVQKDSQLEKLQVKINRFLVTYFLNSNEKKVGRKWDCASDSMGDVFAKINLLTIVERRKLALLSFVPKCKKIDSMVDWFSPSDLRRSSEYEITSLKVTRASSSCYQRSIKWSATLNWNFFVQKVVPQEDWCLGHFINVCCEKLISMRSGDFVT
ncbi:unnamed protein product [Orchesella dallaii]|uniref:Reverse transcriptase domain-containing protein n=1 Tax=Orchesella dallaii TaxID=48710 RepID=A0ABP1RPS4_9HEXA